MKETMVSSVLADHKVRFGVVTPLVVTMMNLSFLREWLPKSLLCDYSMLPV